MLYLYFVQKDAVNSQGLKAILYVSVNRGASYRELPNRFSKGDIESHSYYKIKAK